MNLTSQVQSFQDLIEVKIQELASGYRNSSDVGFPLNEAIAYALEGAGKRIRPLLCLAAAGLEESGDVLIGPALNISVCLEMIHTYSLVHDDLPCMDNDDLRRGRATTHKIYGDAMALLVGDGLLTDSMFRLVETISSIEFRTAFSNHSERGLRILEVISRASGSRGMVSGQGLDIHSSLQSHAQASADTERLLLRIHRKKTGYLLGASLAAGCLMDRNFDSLNTDKIFEAGVTLGLAFQIQDDLLDGQDGTGKSKGKDQNQEKLCFPKLFGERQTRQMLNKIFLEFDKVISEVIPYNQTLNQIVEAIKARKK